MGVYIHNIKDQYGRTDVKGKDPFVELERGIKTMTGLMTMILKI